MVVCLTASEIRRKVPICAAAQHIAEAVDAFKAGGQAQINGKDEVAGGELIDVGFAGIYWLQHIGADFPRMRGFSRTQGSGEKDRCEDGLSREHGELSAIGERDENDLRGKEC